MTTEKQNSGAPVLGCGGLVSLRFVRIGEGKLKSQDGRWTFWRSYGREGSRPAHWTIYDNGKMADAGTYTQCRATALQRLEREAHANIADQPTARTDPRIHE